MKNSISFLRGKLGTLLFTLTMSLSIFSYTGSALAESNVTKATQTEQVVSGDTRAPKRSITFRSKYPNLQSQHVSKQIDALFFYNRLLKIKFTIASSKSYSQLPDYFLLPKTIPSNSTGGAPS